ncbi:putative transmembrane protein [Sesbania bispinosa]|nr:putative transmembrane protein [Sesbania bispinosa]
MEKSMPTNKSKKSLFMCFKPVVGVDDSFKHSRKRSKGNVTDPVLAYLAVADEDGVVLSSAAEVGRKECRSHRKKIGRDRWQALRAAMKEKAMVKKIINRWKTKKDNWSMSSRSNSSNSSNLEGEVGKISNPQCKTTRRTNSNVSSTFGSSSGIFTSSSSLSSTSSSRTTDLASGSSSHEIYSPKPSIPLNGTKQKQCGGVEDYLKRKGNYGSNTALFMLLISLLILIMWGKFSAILFTSIWFYLVPPSRRRPCNEGVSCGGESECDSVQYKKKIIMEGLLERSHSRVSL